MESCSGQQHFAPLDTAYNWLSKSTHYDVDSKLFKYKCCMYILQQFKLGRQ